MLDGTGKPVTLPNTFARNPWGVNRHAKGRALRALEGAGLIAVERPLRRAAFLKKCTWYALFLLFVFLRIFQNITVFAAHIAVFMRR